MLKVVRIAGLLTAAMILGGVGESRFSHNLRGDDAGAYIRRRPIVLTSMANTWPKGEVLIVGDSIVERSGIQSLCGRPVFNAGVSSARLADVDAMAVNLAKILRPSKVIVQIGANDVHPEDSTPAADWGKRYEAMVRELRGTQVVLVQAPAIEPGKSNSAMHDPQRLAVLNGELRGIAQRNGAILLPQPKVDTVDGVHLSSVGIQAWKADLAASCDPHASASAEAI